ncbi:cytochrome P450 [Kineococcus aurantiacus]|uniref:Fatty-acid peroxygenase n=1 Tax=Kineococcus aurantiacus TaxID=37633 RepID=A0A7Y9J266_9ACTN|nr:cytochrome P450 [Kineococcus aurantiacus]NYD23738.1 fatty-acid peroxygenase [Kineococcus aurantiacus]
MSTALRGFVVRGRGSAELVRPELVFSLLLRGFDGLPRLRPAPLPARLLGRRAVLLRGPEGVRTFYDSSRTSRTGAVPAVLSDVLFGRGAVHGLDDAEHRVRKELFTTVLAPERVDGLVTAAAQEWDRAAARWRSGPPVVLFDEAVGVLGRAVLRWSGVRGDHDHHGERDERTTTRRAHDLATIVDGFGSAGPRHLRARAARHRCERWARAAVRDTRAGRLTPPAGSALEEVSRYRGPGGDVLDERLAAVELLNVLRPTVAVAWLVTQAAVALHDDPGWRDLVRDAPPERAQELAVAVAHEVRRRHPFVPALAARARRGTEVGGVRLRAGDRLVLDVVGTHRDPAQWPDPELFDPGRFAGQGECPVSHAFAPQGAGDARTGHRCPGEPATVRLLAQAVRVLCHEDLRFPPQDLRAPARPVPSRPASGVVLDVGPRTGPTRTRTDERRRVRA